MTAPSGPSSLYWLGWYAGADAFEGGLPLLACPYADDGPDARPFTGRAWRDGWRAKAAKAGVPLLADEVADETTPAPRRLTVVS